MSHFIRPPMVVNRGEKPEAFEQMVFDAARNLKLTKRATKLLTYYAGCKNGFRPSLTEIEKNTGIGNNKISVIRKELVAHGVIGYGEEFRNVLVVDWNRMRAFAMLEKPLEYQKKNSEKYFSVVRAKGSVSISARKDYETLSELGQKYRIPGVTVSKDRFLKSFGFLTGKEYTDLVRSFPEYGQQKYGKLISDAEYAKYFDVDALLDIGNKEHTYTPEEAGQYERNVAFMKAAPQELPF